jgi:hypothetical protein
MYESSLGAYYSGVSGKYVKKRLCFSFFIKSSLLHCEIFQDTDDMFTQCIIVYYFMYLHTNDMESREEAEEKQKKHMTILKIKCVGIRPHLEIS